LHGGAVIQTKKYRHCNINTEYWEGRLRTRELPRPEASPMPLRKSTAVLQTWTHSQHDLVVLRAARRLGALNARIGCTGCL
jgi:hypothetical protein